MGYLSCRDEHFLQSRKVGRVSTVMGNEDTNTINQPKTSSHNVITVLLDVGLMVTSRSMNENTHIFLPFDLVYAKLLAYIDQEHPTDK